MVSDCEGISLWGNKKKQVKVRCNPRMSIYIEGYTGVDSTLCILGTTLFWGLSFLRLVNCVIRLVVSRTLLELAVAGGEDQGAATVKFSAAGSKNS